MESALFHCTFVTSERDTLAIVVSHIQAETPRKNDQLGLVVCAALVTKSGEVPLSTRADTASTLVCKLVSGVDVFLGIVSFVGSNTNHK